jgi:hypothetical protein
MAEKRYCGRCGVELDARHFRWCRACSDAVRRERSRIYSQKKRANEVDQRKRVKLCARCGAEFVTLQGDRIYCDECRLLPSDRQRERFRGVSPGYGGPQADGEGSNPAARLQRAQLITERQLQQLAELYGPPYDSYGKVKAYIREYGKLPPGSCLRSAHPHVVDVQAFQPTPGDPWFV